MGGSKISKLFLIIFGSIILLILFKDLNPFDSQIFIGHDQTQASRISEFYLNLQNFHIPPRIAPNFSFKLGFPIFNYYAPFAYWITSFIHALGIDIPRSIEISFISAILTACFGMYLFLRHYFGKIASFVGAISYISSPYVAVDIFVRMNLAELWFFALLPLSLFFILKIKKYGLFPTALIVSFLFTSHNIFSLIAVPFILIFAILTKNKLSIIATISALFLSSYFWIPALFELSDVHAAYSALTTKYSDHFLCPTQLWASNWGFGGSTKGCAFDGMSFMVGKIHLIVAALGLIILLSKPLRNEKSKNYPIFISFGLFLLASLFLTTEYSAFLWNFFKPILSLFQFPWRFLLVSVFGLAFFITFFISNQKLFVRIFLAITILSSILYSNNKLIKSQKLSLEEYDKRYLSEEYITNKSAFKIPEYLPISADFNYWHSLEYSEQNRFNFTAPIGNSLDNFQYVKSNEYGPFTRSFTVKKGFKVILNIHNASYWEIKINNERFIPKNFDKLGRPIINLDPNKTYKFIISYQVTPIEKISNIFFLLSVIMLLIYSYKSNLCSKKQTH